MDYIHSLWGLWEVKALKIHKITFLLHFNLKRNLLIKGSPQALINMDTLMDFNIFILLIFLWIISMVWRFFSGLYAHKMDQTH